MSCVNTKIDEWRVMPAEIGSANNDLSTAIINHASSSQNCVREEAQMFSVKPYECIACMRELFYALSCAQRYWLASSLPYQWCLVNMRTCAWFALELWKKKENENLILWNLRTYVMFPVHFELFACFAKPGWVVSSRIKLYTELDFKEDFYLWLKGTSKCTYFGLFWCQFFNYVTHII